ncbi:MAG: 1-acyl-sn-glycerol-3-phosphate acyltransferase [Clostridia bacterium]|nr:1-acyl-sn-glycerol-3-phosphate acyltransferase [Clostridia bacterium]
MGVFYSVVRTIFGPLYKLFLPTKKLGYKEQPFDGSTVVICNHLSNFDCATLTTSFKKQSYFLAKKEVFKNKFVGAILRGMGGISIDRDKPEFSEIKNTLKLLKERKRLIIFPEGTRNKECDGNLLPLKGGAGMFAFKAKARIIPVYLNKPNRFFRRNYMYIGEPFDLAEFYGEKFTQELSDKISAKMAEQIMLCKQKLEEYFENKKKKKKK